MKRHFLAAAAGIALAHSVLAAPVTDPNDPRTWQGASVGTFAQLYFGSNTLVNRQKVIDNGLLDDGIFNTTGYVGATMIQATGVQSSGTSLDTTGTGSYGYTQPCACGSTLAAGSGIDQHWVQTDNVIGHSVWDLGFQATKAAVFNTIDHGPLPLEAIESTVYLSNDRITWTQAVVERVWLEGFQSNTGILWDGFVYAVGTGTSDTFRYASIIWGGLGALQADGDNEINGIMGLQGDFTPPPAVPEPSTYALMLAGLAAAAGLARSRRAR
jgi:PEP-CTERM motif